MANYSGSNIIIDLGECYIEGWRRLCCPRMVIVCYYADLHRYLGHINFFRKDAYR